MRVFIINKSLLYMSFIIAMGLSSAGRAYSTSFDQYDKMPPNRQSQFLDERGTTIYRWLFKDDPVKVQSRKENFYDYIPTKNYPQAMLDFEKLIRDIPAAERGTKKDESLMMGCMVNQLCGYVTTQTDGFDFRNVKWGMTKEEVVKTEGRSPVSEKYSDILKRYLVLYIGEIGGLETIIGYHFKNNVLVSGGYEIIEEHKYDNDYVDDYKKLKSLLSNKYGEPEFDIKKWANNTVQNNYEFW